MAQVLVDEEDLAVLIVDWEASASPEHDEERQAKVDAAYARLQEPKPYQPDDEYDVSEMLNTIAGLREQIESAVDPTPLLHQREMLRKALQMVLVKAGAILPHAGLGDLDATNDGALLCMVAEDWAFPMLTLDTGAEGAQAVYEAEIEEDVLIDGHKISVYGQAFKGEDVIVEMFTDSIPTQRMAVRFTEDDAREHAHSVLGAFGIDLSLDEPSTGAPTTTESGDLMAIARNINNVVLEEFTTALGEVVVWAAGADGKAVITRVRQSVNDPLDDFTHGMLVKTVEPYAQRAEEAALRSIEARNPGIDMDEVRRTRAERGDSNVVGILQPLRADAERSEYVHDDRCLSPAYHEGPCPLPTPDIGNPAYVEPDTWTPKEG